LTHKKIAAAVMVAAISVYKPGYYFKKNPGYPQIAGIYKQLVLL
jgi:hypothetical protein